MIELEPIGVARTPIQSTDDAPRQGMHETIEGKLEIEPEFVEGLDGYETGDEVLVIWFADRADRSLLRVDKRDNRGVFKSRSPARPNPICLTTVTVLDVEEDGLRVSGVDMLDGSPVLDLKIPLS